MTVDELAFALRTDGIKGIGSTEASRRLKVYGPNSFNWQQQEQLFAKKILKILGKRNQHITLQQQLS